jgi:glucosamine kinase
MSATGGYRTAVAGRPDAAREPRDWLVLGGDVGGTSTRILVAGGDGTSRQRGSAGGGNPISHPDTAAAAFEQALRAALVGVDPARVRTAVLGVAGGSVLSEPRMAGVFARAWWGAGLCCPPVYVSDLEVAFASGTPEPDGTVLVAGTGASAACVRQHRSTRTADGYGWLLGDEGSAFWIGRQAVRATLHTLDAGGPLGELETSVLRVLDAIDVAGHGRETGRQAQRVRLIHVVNRNPPVRLAELAPAVAEAHQAGDEQARQIVAEAAQLLVGSMERVRQPDETTPIVMAGSLLADSSPVGTAVRQLVAERCTGPVASATDGAVGAAWLALSVADPECATDDVRARLAQE